MFKSIMIALADPVVDASAIKAAVRIVRSSAARLHIVHVQTGRNEDNVASFDSDLLGAVDWAADELGDSVSFRQLYRAGYANPKEAIATALQVYASEHHIDLIVMARRRHSLNRFLLGSVAERLLFAQDAPILFTPQHGNTLPARGCRIMLPLDGSSGGEAVLADAVNLARALKGSLSLLRVQPEGQPVGVGAAEADSCLAEEASTGAALAELYLERIAALAENRGVPTHWLMLAGERIASAVCKTATAGRAHIIALAPRRAARSLSFAPDSVTEQLLRKGETALLLRRQPDM